MGEKGSEKRQHSVNNPLARGIKLFFKTLEGCLELSNLVFYYTRFVDIEATFLAKKEGKVTF